MFNPKLEIFNNELGNVRMAFDKEGQPWFLLNDVAAQLGLTNPTEAVKGAVLAKRIDITDIARKKQVTGGFLGDDTGIPDPRSGDKKKNDPPCRRLSSELHRRAVDG